MAIATATPATRTANVIRVPVLASYVGVLVVAEVLVAYVDGTGAFVWQEWGLALHIVLVFALLFHAVFAHATEPTYAHLLTALSLASLIRIFSLAVPRFTFDILTWLGLVSVPLLVTIVAVSYVQGLRRRDFGLGLRVLEPRNVLAQVGIALTGVPLGVLEYYLLAPTIPAPYPWIESLDVGVVTLLGASAVIFLATGVSEELIFRGILLKRAVEGLGSVRGVLLVSIVFASLHIFFRSAADLVFVFGIGLFYAVAVLRTRSLWGVIFSHSLGNVVLYLLAPFLLS